MAVYCRISTAQLEQLSSYEDQAAYYIAHIINQLDFEMVKVY